MGWTESDVIDNIKEKRAEAKVLAKSLIEKGKDLIDKTNLRDWKALIKNNEHDLNALRECRDALEIIYYHKKEDKEELNARLENLKANFSDNPDRFRVILGMVDIYSRPTNKSFQQTSTKKK